MKMVTITNSGITQTVPENELPLYTRAGYAVVVNEPFTASPDLKVELGEVAPVADLVPVVEESAPVKKTGKKN